MQSASKTKRAICLMLPLLFYTCNCGVLDLNGYPGSDDDSTVDGLPDNLDQDSLHEISPDMGFDSDIQEPDGYCEPPGGAWFYFTIDGTDWPREEHIDFDIRCQLDLVSVGAGVARITLNCWNADGAFGFHEIDIASGHELPWGNDDPMEGDLRFRYVAETSFWANRWFTLRDWEGNLLLAGIDAERLTPYPDDEDDNIFTPFELSAAGEVCPVLPGECSDVERLAVDVAVGDESIRVFDNGEGEIESPARLLFIVDKAEHYHGSWICGGEMPERWFSVFIFGLL